MTKKIKPVLQAAMVMAVFCAGTVSARQLFQVVATTSCRGFCNKNAPCPNILGCGCVIQPGFTTGVCNFIAAKPTGPAK